MIAAAVFWMSVSFHATNELTVLKVFKSEQECLRSLSSIPEVTLTFCIPGKIPVRK